MGPKTQNLLGLIEELIELLESENEKDWSNWFRKSETRIKNSDFSGIELVLNAYGGMGSFSDLIICQNVVNDKVEFTESYEVKNEKLNKLRSEVWALAESIKREQ